MSERVWEGERQLEALLVPIESVEAHPDNPRIGNIDMIAASLREFGQMTPIVVQSSTGWICKGNHVKQAAERLEWTHIAVVVSDLGDEEALTYLAVDNRTSDVGTYNSRKLLDLLEARDRHGRLELTGYNRDALDKLTAAVGRDKVSKPATSTVSTAERKEAMTFVLTADDMSDVRRWIAMLQRELRMEDPSDVIHAAIKAAAERL